MKKWSKPMVMILGVESTREDLDTFKPEGNPNNPDWCECYKATGNAHIHGKPPGQPGNQGCYCCSHIDRPMIPIVPAEPGGAGDSGS